MKTGFFSIPCCSLFVFGVLSALQPKATFGAENTVDAVSDGVSGATLSGMPAAMLAPAMLEASGAVVGKVNIRSGSIFDLDDPDENKALFRLANRLHATTRPAVIQQQLLFEPGDRFSVQALEESERILRANRYIDKVAIQPVRNENGSVDINVETNDVWTLMPRLSLSRSGGTNKSAVGLKEQNLLGSGTAIEVMFKSDVDRDSRIFKYRDRNLGDSWYGLTFDYEDNSDGHLQFLEIGKPFYSLHTRSAQGLSVLDRDSIGTFYNRGEIASEYEERHSGYEIYRGWSRGLQNGWARRYTAGLAYDERRFDSVTDSAYTPGALPQDRQLLTPFVGIEILENHYEKSSNHDQISRIEDRFLGTRISARLGIARQSAGSDRDAWLLNVGAQTGFGSSDSSSLILASKLGGRIEQGGAQNFALDVRASYYKRQSDRRLLYMGVTGTYGHNLDLDQYLVLGGDTGMRGYPLRFQTGDKRAVFTIEQRYFTDWYPFRLFHVGGAAFFDVGRTWGSSPVGVSNSQLLKDVGVGLRIGSSRSGLGRMIHVDVAVPLDDTDGIDGVQFLVSTRKSF
ncbi:MAG: POTRA domain-containing protein [Woeseiaceae bacterium]